MSVDGSRIPFLDHFKAGVAETREAFLNHADSSSYSLTKEQHPIFALISGCGPTEQASCVFGGDLAGSTLVHSTSGSAVVGKDGSHLTLPIRAFISLAKSKGIRQIVHEKSGRSELIEAIYVYCKEQEGAAGYRERMHDMPQILRDYAKGRAGLYREVKNNGLDWYSHLGIDMSGGSKEDKERLAMVAEQSIRDERELNMVRRDIDFFTVVQNPIDGSVYYLRKGDPSNDVKPCFIKVPTDKEMNPLAFISLFSDDGEEFIANALMEGATKFKKFLKGSCNKEITIAGVFCSDSRSGAKRVIGKELAERCYSFRNPGASIINDKGSITPEGELFLALSAWKNRPVLITGHSDCGAFKIAYDCCLGSEAAKNVSGSFKKFSALCKPVYDDVFGSFGKDNMFKDDFSKWAKHVFGIGHLSEPDAFSLAHLNKTVEAVQKSGIPVEILRAYQHLETGDCHVSKGISPFYKVSPSKISGRCKKRGRPAIRAGRVAPNLN